MDALFTRPASAGPFRPSIDQELKAACPKVLSVTVSHAYDPYAVFVHLKEGEELTPEEHRALEAIVQAHGQE